MIILIDTNIILDIGLNRDPLSIESKTLLSTIIKNSDKMYFSASAVTDCYYTMKKHKLSKDEIIHFLSDIASLMSFAEVNEDCIYNAFLSPMPDFEDAVIDVIATNINADYIITRNKKDFINASNKVLTPTEFLEQY